MGRGLDYGFTNPNVGNEQKKNLVPQVSPGKSIITVSSENNVTVLIP